MTDHKAARETAHRITLIPNAFLEDKLNLARAYLELRKLALNVADPLSPIECIKELRKALEKDK